MENIKGLVTEIIYRSEETNYTVIKISKNDESINCVGNMLSPVVGQNINANGMYIEHPLYGRQFKITDYTVEEPTTEENILVYLSSGAVKGIGSTIAERIVSRFGTDSLNVMENNPDQLSLIKGISRKKALEISATMQQEKSQRAAIIYLQSHGIGMSLAVKIYEKYREKTATVIQKTPYRLINDIKGIGFKTADDIALSMGYTKDCDERIEAGIFYTLTNSINEGNVYLPQDILIKNSSETLKCPLESIDDHLSKLAIEGKIFIREVNDEKIIYYSYFYNVEQSIAGKLNELNVDFEVDEEKIGKDIDETIASLHIIPDEKQKSAVFEAFKKGVLVITGGPGTGKTTVINTIIRLFESQGKDVLLAAPTGRAAKRMSEATNHEASTIHRLLEVKTIGDDSERSRFERNEDYPLETDVLIIDEMSMLDMFLMNSMLKAVPKGCRLILTGDVDQLPSVGPGAVLKDIISSDCFNTVSLTNVYRQAAESDIIKFAHEINKGLIPDIKNTNKDFYFLEKNSVHDIMSIMLGLILYKIPETLKISPMDVQVLTPVKDSPLGVNSLNSILQKNMNPEADTKSEYQSKTTLFREGDKVMQIKNNYKTEWQKRNTIGSVIESGVGVFNGDIGVIYDINNFSKTMTVIFDDNRYVDYSFNATDELELAYAITIHKSQGSEYPAVVLPVFSGPSMLMNRNLLYTAITRAKDFAVLVGSVNNFEKMINQVNSNKRFTSLDERIKEYELLQ